ncbi:DUF3168 domain-containing protein [Methylobacterium sp. D54C]
MTGPASPRPPITPETAFLDAVRAHLRADPALAALVAGRVYDALPGAEQRIAPPYLYAGPLRRQRLDTACGEAWTVQLRLYAVSTAFGRHQAWAVIDAAATALADREPPDFALPPPFAVQQPLIVTQAGDVVDPLNPRQVFLDVTTIVARLASD